MLPFPVEDPERLREAMQKIAAETPDGNRQNILLRALQYEYDKGDGDTRRLSRRLAHRIIANRAGANPEAVQAMRHFYKADKMMPRDVQKFKAQKRTIR